MAALAPAGGDCVVAAFPDADTTGLAAARAITTATGSTVGAALTDALNPRLWPQSRNALATLGPRAVAAPPAVLRLLTGLDAAPEAVVRERALASAVAMSAPRERALAAAVAMSAPPVWDE